MTDRGLSQKRAGFVSDIVIPILVSGAMLIVFLAIGYALVSVFMRSAEVFSPMWGERVQNEDAEYVESQIAQLRDNLLRRLVLGAAVAFTAAFVWYVVLFFSPISGVGEARGRRPLWFFLLGVVALCFAALFILPFIPVIAALMDDTFTARANATLSMVSGVSGTIGISIAYWMATAVGTPRYARTAIPGASGLPF